MDFDMMGLSPQIVARMAELNITEPTPIQKKAIPEALNGRDVMGLAQTGTGKTAAFGLPLIHRMKEAQRKAQPKSVQSLVLAPTRELAKQILDNLKDYGEGSHLRMGLVVGGASITAQINRLKRGTHILVATPGRLIDLLDRNALYLDETEFLVLDEADQMLDLGFIHALRKIAQKLPAERQTMLFSATMAKHMGEIAKTYLKDPVRVEVARPGVAADKIDQNLIYVEQAEKTAKLKELLAGHPGDLSIVFAATKHGAERLCKSLNASGFAAASVHGNKSQGQRTRALQEFKDGKVQVLVATDVAARGLDIPDVRHVYNYDLPNVADNYVHRIGRTARAGKDGRAVAFCGPQEMSELRAIEKTLGMSINVIGGEPWSVKAGGRGKPKPRPANRRRRPARRKAA